LWLNYLRVFNDIYVECLTRGDEKREQTNNGVTPPRLVHTRNRTEASWAKVLFPQQSKESGVVTKGAVIVLNK
jgi:hypothetical protein